MKTYSGKYKVKNVKKYEGDHTNVTYRSMWEKHCFEWCDKNTDILKWSSEEVVIPYFYDVDQKFHRYFIDLKIVFKDKRTLLVEVKPKRQTNPPKGDKRTKKYLNEAYTYIKNMKKWEAANQYAADRGWFFQIWTENELKEMSILPKTPGKLAKMKPMRRKKTKRKSNK